MKREENKPFAADLPAVGEERKPLPAVAASKQQKKGLGRKRTLALLALVFFLFSVIFIVPVGRIPVLRNVSWLMGFSTQETGAMSFFRTLLSWATDSERRSRPGSWSGDGGEISLFDRQMQQAFNASGPASGLFDLRAVNAARRAQGLPADGLYGVYGGTDENAAAMNRPVNGWSEEARRAAAQQAAQDVYFGTDADAAARALAERGQIKGSSDTALLLPAANIWGAAAVDWLGVAVDKASLLSNSKMADALREAAEINAPLSNLGGRLTAGAKPRRDLATIWLMSMAAEKAPQAMLKKQLASAGYMAMEMPKKVYDSSGQTSGVMISSGELLASFDTANEMLLKEEECNRISGTANDTIQPKLSEAKSLILALRNVPKSCGDDMQTWSANLKSIKTNCNEVNDVYNNMKTFCGANVTSGRCETARLDSYESSYNEICAGYENLSDEDKALRDEQLAEASADIDYEVKDSFNLSVDGEEAGGNDFFPTSKFE